MSAASVEIWSTSELKDILVPDEQLLWSGSPDHGKKFFEPVWDEKTYHICFCIGAIVLLLALPFIQSDAAFSRFDAYFVFAALLVSFLSATAYIASVRAYALSNLLYVVTDLRAMVLRRAPNWRFATRLYVVSCPLDKRYNYELIDSSPLQSLRIGTLLSKDALQPFGYGLSHPAQPILWNRTLSPVVFELISEAATVRKIVLNAASELS